MSTRTHWDTVYRTKAADQVSWYRAHLERSLAFIEAAAPDPAAAIIDVGGGESTLVDDLVRRGHRDVTVLDVAPSAIAAAKARLGAAAEHVHWLVADITTVELPLQRYDLWHDRAVFHFLIHPEDRAAYVRQALRAVRRGGYVVVATFGPQGPEKCSGLPVQRYDPAALSRTVGDAFELVDQCAHRHATPWDGVQSFQFSVLRRR